MDVTPFLPLRPAPAIVFDQLAARADSPRFMVPDGDGYRPVTWRTFADQIRECALGLQPTLAAGDRACIFAPNSVEWMSAALAIQAAGGVMVPIYGSSTAEQAAYVIDHSDAKVVFVDTDTLLRRVIDAMGSCERVERVVLIDSALEASLAELPEAQRARFVTFEQLRDEGRQ
ncbi:MAG: AMP-binding protein, partial [Myxococcota bacterium]